MSAVAKKILLVEDSDVDATTIQNMVKNDPYELIWAKNGEDALRKMAESEFDVVLLDIMLPGIDGYKVCDEIKKKNRTKPVIIMVSSKDSVENIKKAFDIGADDYVIKPYNPDYLSKKLKIYLGDI